MKTSRGKTHCVSKIRGDVELSAVIHTPTDSAWGYSQCCSARHEHPSHPYQSLWNESGFHNKKKLIGLLRNSVNASGTTKLVPPSFQKSIFMQANRPTRARELFWIVVLISLTPPIQGGVLMRGAAGI